jgi:hypothetical protein
MNWSAEESVQRDVEIAKLEQTYICGSQSEQINGDIDTPTAQKMMCCSHTALVT